MKKPYKTLSSKIVYQNLPWLRVREDQILHPDGRPGLYSVVETVEAAFIVAVNGQQEVYLVRQFRYPTQELGWEVSSGGIDAGEQPLQAAKRELQEEMGLSAAKWTALGAYHAVNGYANTRSHFFLAQDLQEDSSFQPPTNEGITEVCKVPLEKLSEYMTPEHMPDGQSVFALLLALPKLSRH